MSIRSRDVNGIDMAGAIPGIGASRSLWSRLTSLFDDRKG